MLTPVAVHAGITAHRLRSKIQIPVAARAKRPVLRTKSKTQIPVAARARIPVLRTRSKIQIPAAVAAKTSAHRPKCKTHRHAPAVAPDRAHPATNRILTAHAAGSATQATTSLAQSIATMLIGRCSRLAAADAAQSSAPQEHTAERLLFNGLSITTTREHLTT